MEFLSHTIKQTNEKCKAFSQVTLDDDYIVRDNKPDVIKIIYSGGTIVFEESRISNQTLWVSGKLEFYVLYRSDENISKLEVLNGSVPFQEKLVMDHVSDMDQARVYAEIEDISISLINSRKLSIRAVANLKAIVEEEIEEEIASQLEAFDDCQQNISEKELLSILASEKDLIRFHDEIKLSNAKANIGKIIWQDVNLRGTESSITNGRIHIQGEIYVCAIYLAEDDNQLQWVESILPISKDLDLADAKEENAKLLWLKMKKEAAEVEIRNDYDGEARILGVDATFAVEYKIWCEKKIPVLMDAYALNRKIELTKEPCTFMNFLMKNEATIRVAETCKLDSNQEKILQICSGTGKIMIDHLAVEEKGVHVEGLVSVHFLYLTADDNYPIAHAQNDLPFDQLIEINGMQKDTWFDYETVLDHLQINLLDNSEYEIKASFRMGLIAFAKNSFEKVSEVQESTIDMDELAKQPGMVGYIVQEGEELWDVAKRYHTTTDEIASTNNIKATNVKTGTKLVIVKKISM